VYEYEDSYLWYIINKKIDLEQEFIVLFQNKEIREVYIDNVLRKFPTKEDCLLSESLKIIVFK
jgi:hypothetical protein